MSFGCLPTSCANCATSTSAKARKAAHATEEKNREAWALCFFASRARTAYLAGGANWRVDYAWMARDKKESEGKFRREQPPLSKNRFARAFAACLVYVYSARSLAFVLQQLLLAAQLLTLHTLARLLNSCYLRWRDRGLFCVESRAR